MSLCNYKSNNSCTAICDISLSNIQSCFHMLSSVPDAPHYIHLPTVMFCCVIDLLMIAYLFAVELLPVNTHSQHSCVFSFPFVLTETTLSFIAFVTHSQSVKIIITNSCSFCFDI